MRAMVHDVGVWSAKTPLVAGRVDFIPVAVLWVAEKRA